MKQDTRSKNSIRNIIFSIIAHIVKLILGFLGRRYFIYYFSTEYLGLNSLFANVISILSLAELGFGTALVFAMYKPMASGDDEKVRQLLSYYKKCYLIIGIVMSIAGMFVLPFMGYFKAKAPNVDVNLYIVYIITLFNTVVSYFFAHRRSLLYTSQRSDIESKVSIVTTILSDLTKIAIVIFTRDYYLYIAVSGVFVIIDNLFVYFTTQRLFPELVKKPNTPLDLQVKKDIKKNIFALLINKISTVIVFGTDSLLIYMLFDANTLGIYSNYLLVTNAVSQIIAIFINAIRGSVGNAIAKEDSEYNYKLFTKLNFIYFAIISFSTVCIFALVNPFISTILNKDPSTNLLLGDLERVLICVSFYLTQSRAIVVVFKDCNGLFCPYKFAPVIESIINLVASVVLAQFMGLGGVILGTIISSVFVPIWLEPYILNKHYFKKPLYKYFIRYILYAFCMLVSGAVAVLVANLIPQLTVWWVVIKFVLTALSAGTMVFLTMCFFPEFRETLSWGKTIIRNFFKRKKAE